MNGIGMASITAFYNLHLRDKHARQVPQNMVPKATRYIPERVCAPFCLPSTCPILHAFLTHDDMHFTREVRKSTAQHVDGFGSLFG
jgi:hypothetical protein